MTSLTKDPEDSISFLYQDALSDRFAVREQISETTDQELESLSSSCDPASGCGAASPLSRGGATGVLMQGDPAPTSIDWLV